MKLKLLSALLFFIPIFSNAQKLNFEVGLGLGYQPKAQLVRQGGSSKEIVWSRGFISYQLSGNLLYNIKPKTKIGLALNLISMPEFYFTDISETNFYAKYPFRTRRTNSQSEEISMDIGILLRQFIYHHKQYSFYTEIIPSIKLNASSSLGKTSKDIEGTDTITHYDFIYEEGDKVNFSGHLMLGVQKKLKRNYYNLCLYYTRSFQDINARYISMPNEPEFSYGTLHITNHQVGIKFMLGLGKRRE